MREGYQEDYYYYNIYYMRRVLYETGHGQAMSRRRRAASPAAARATATRQSTSRGSADTAPPGSRGACVNGEMSRIQWDSCSTWPNRSITTTTPSAVHAPG